MSIERLNKAATAAGFAMATPDEEPIVPTKPSTSAALVVATPDAQKQSLLTNDPVQGLTNWLKGHLPGIGWGQPA